MFSAHVDLVVMEHATEHLSKGLTEESYLWDSHRGYFFKNSHIMIVIHYLIRLFSYFVNNL